VSSMHIDLKHGPCVRLGHEMFQQLIGAHMVAQSEEELQLLVTYSMDEILDSNPQHSVCVTIHAAYYAQAVAMGLLDLATQQRIALEEAGLDVDPGVRQRNPDRFERERLGTWHEVQEELNISLG